MPDITKHCDVVQGFNLTPNIQATVGYLTEMKIGKDKFTQKLKPPKVSGKGKQKVVAVLSSVSWDGESASPLFIEGQIDVEGWAKLYDITLSSGTNMLVEWKFECWDYDQSEKAQKYFQSFMSDGKLQGRFMMDNRGELMITTAPSPSGVIASPPVYHFYIALVPKPKEQKFKVASNSKKPRIMVWGIDGA